MNVKASILLGMAIGLSATDTAVAGSSARTGWFDAKVQEYRAWPDDAAKAVGGAWNAGETPLKDVARVEKAGELHVNTEAELGFDAARPKTLGRDAHTLTLVSDVAYVPYNGDEMPAVDPKWKGGVIRVREADDTSAYYGLARDGATNAWVRLEGPAATNGTVRFVMMLRRSKGRSVVNYSIGGTDYTLGGKKDIELIVTDAVKGVALSGEGAVSSLEGKSENGIMIFAR